MIYGSIETALLLGNIANDLQILNNREYEINSDMFTNQNHLLLFESMKHLARDKSLKEVDSFYLETILRSNPLKHKRFVEEGLSELLELFKEKAKGTSVKYNYETVVRATALTSAQSFGFDISELLNESLPKENLNEQIEKLNKMSIDEILTHFSNKLSGFKNVLRRDLSEDYSFHAKDGLHNLLKKCKEEPKWGKAFQSKYLNTIIRGMQGSKLLIRSAPTGGGKSRQSMADACNLSIKEKYNLATEEWEYNGDAESSLFISTELVKEEVQLAMLAFASGINELTIKNGNWSNYEDKILKEAIDVIEDSNLYCHYIADFSLSDIEDIIVEHILKYNVKYVFFDYLQIASKLSSEMQAKFKMSLRGDEILANFSAALKRIANKYDVYVCTSTQLNRSYKNDAEPDPTHLRGGMATADKADHGIITLPVGIKEKEALMELTKSGIANTYPTVGHFIFKNRGGAWKGVIVWTHFNMGNMREEDCFVTDLNYNLITDITPESLLKIEDKMTPANEEQTKLIKDLIESAGITNAE